MELYMSRHLVAGTVASFLLASTASAQMWSTFDAAAGTLPQEQCWTHVEDISPPMTYPLGVSGGSMYLSTLAFASTGATGGAVYWQRSDVTIDFTKNFAVEARVKIVNAPDHIVNTVTGWPRPGYCITVVDNSGRVFWVGFGNNEIFLSNSLYGQYGASNTQTLAFNTTDAFHLYRLERGGGGVGARLRIDGADRLNITTNGAVETAPGLVYFGDPTYWANSESYTSMVRYTSNAGCASDFNGDGETDFFDYLDFVDAFSAAECSADFNGDGTVDFFDYLDFVDAFSVGC